MFTFTHKSFCPSKWYQQIYRFLNTAEIASILRPFYFAVHPDFFGKHPEQRSVNENSLKQLSSFLTSLQSGKAIRSTKLPFYLRTTSDRDKFLLVYIPLNAQENTHSTIRGILRACKLPTDQLDKIQKPKSSTVNEVKRRYKSKHTDDIEKDLFADIIFATQKAKEAESLKNWLSKNGAIAQKRYNALKELKEEVQRLQHELINNLQLSELRWECGWNIEHYRGCLKSLQGLYNLHPKALKVLKDRVLVFAPFTGVSLDGHVMLNSGEVRHNWFELIKNVDSHEKTLRNIPAHEYALSKVLRDIRVARRKYMPKILASEYASHLRKITTSLLDFLSKTKYPSHWPEKLSEFEIVVECEAGPLMVSPTGQIITPSSYPGSLLVDFISENLDLARKNMLEYNK